MDKFSQRVYEVVRGVPYGQVACMAGSPRAARAVGNILHRNPDPRNIPCHRVVNARGEVSHNYAFGGSQAQTEKLTQEIIRKP